VSFGVARRKKRRSGEGMGFRSGFKGERGSVEDRERESSHGAGLRTASGTGVPFGCVAAARHRRPDVAGRKEDSAGSGKAAVRQGRARGRAQSGARAAGVLHMVGIAAAAARVKKQGRRGRGRRRRTQTQFAEKIGTLL
jgi:hypothetical protein